MHPDSIENKVVNLIIGCPLPSALETVLKAALADRLWLPVCLCFCVNFVCAYETNNKGIILPRGGNTVSRKTKTWMDNVIQDLSEKRH